MKIILVYTYKPQAADFFESSGNVLKQLDRKKLKELCLDRLKDKTSQYLKIILSTASKLTCLAYECGEPRRVSYQLPHYHTKCGHTNN